MKSKTLIMVFEKDMGIFMGNYQKQALWSKCDIMESHKVYGFKTMKEATYYVDNHMDFIKGSIDFFEIPCNSSTYIDVIDIIKAGHKDKTEELFLCLPTNPIIN
jgi:hypothetical protein